MQNSLFDELELPAPRVVEQSSDMVKAAAPQPELVELADALPAHLRLGTSSWSYPGWAGLVWDGEYSETRLSRYGLTAYAQHPLFRTVSLDRGFYRPLTAEQFGTYADQVDDEFRFVVKAPSLITDALLRGKTGRGIKTNPSFLDVEQTLSLFIEPVLQGLGAKLGALVFQISPLPISWLGHMNRLLEQLHALLGAIPNLKTIAPDAAIAVEVRDREWLTPQFIQTLRDTGATYCMGLHAKMPSIAEQLPILRALWPGPLVCRWNLNPLHGAYGYESAQRQYEPYDRMLDPDPDTRAVLARVIAGTVGAGQNAYVTLSNKAEGSSPLSVIELARCIREHAPDRPAG